MRYEVLDSWRGLCAIFVAVFHFEVLSHIYGFSFIRNGFLFVDFFFVLSGFIIQTVYGVGRLNDGRSYISFAIRRFGRLWPLHIAMTLIFIPPEFAKLYLINGGGMIAEEAAFSGRYSLDSLAYNFVMGQCSIDGTLSWNFPSWSISYELIAYFFFAIIFLLARGKAYLFHIALVVLSLSMLALYSENFLGTKCDNGLYRCFAGFFSGALVARLVSKTNFDDVNKALFTVTELMVIVLVVVFVSMAGTTWLNLLAPLVFGLAVLIFSSEKGRISQLLLLKPFVFLGGLSYSIYLVHTFILLIIGRGASVIGQLFDINMKQYLEAYNSSLLFYHSKFLMDALLLVYVLVVIFVSYLTYCFIESPGRRFFNKLASRVERESSKDVAGCTLGEAAR